MRKSDLQFISETLLIENFIQDCKEERLVKFAGVVQDLGLDSMVGGIVDFAKSQFDMNNPGTSIAKLLVPAVLFKVNWVLGALYVAITSITGFDISSIINAAKNVIIPKVEAGQKVAPEEINEAVKSAARPLIETDAAEVGAANDGMFGMLSKRNSEEYQTLIKVAAGGGILQRIFGNLFSGTAGKPFLGKIKWLITGLIGWTLKTSLLGLGLLGVGAVAANLLGVKKKAPEDATDQTTPSAETSIETKPSAQTPSAKPIKIPTSGAGTKMFDNNLGNEWVVPLTQDSVDETLLDWTVEIYPSLSRYIADIAKTPKFNQVVSEFENMDKKGIDPNEVRVPTVYHSRKQVVDSFIAPLIKGS